MAVTIDGLVSGIDTEKIISGLLEIQQTQVDRFTLRRSEIQQKQAAFRGIEARLLTLRTDISRLSRFQNNPLSKQAVTVSDDTAVAATASDNAVPGVYQLTVNARARAHQVASQGYADADAQITQGTLELRVGAGDVSTITIDGNNNTLNGLMTAINSAGAGVTASIVKDAAGGATPWRLLLTSTKTGAEQAISLTNNLAASAGSAVRVEVDLNNPVQAATDASITLGSGAGAISVSSATNRFSDVIAGVSLDLLQVSAGEEVTLTVAQDTVGAVEAVEDFVNSFNAVMQYIDEQSRFNAETNEGGLLLGNRSAITVQQRLRSAVVSVVPGVNSQVNRLSALGVSVTDNGRLLLNKSRLEQVLSGGVENVSARDVRRLFAFDAVSNSGGVSFVLGSSRTKAPDAAVQVDVTQAPEQATLTAATPLAASTVIDASNRQLELKLDGATASVMLQTGTYTPQQLADHLESVINASSEFAGRSISVGLSGGQLRLTSEAYGTSSELLIVGGTSVTALGLTAGQSAVGKDVAGTFVVNGVSEPASGRGRLLSGNADNQYTADMQVRVTLNPAQIVAGAEAELSVTSGIGVSLDRLLGDLLKSDSGILAAADDGFDDQIDSIQQTIDRQKAAFDRAQASLLKQFTALESAISSLKTTSSFVSSQLAGISS